MSWFASTNFFHYQFFTNNQESHLTVKSPCRLDKCFILNMFIAWFLGQWYCYKFFCEKLKIYGMNEKSVCWFNSFLTNRSQKIKINIFCRYSLHHIKTRQIQYHVRSWKSCKRFSLVSLHTSDSNHPCWRYPLKLFGRKYS